MVKLSIIIPTYNISSYIVECLSSVVPQLTDECELTIVDDCSTDDTVATIKKYLGKRKHTLIVNSKNSGVSHSRNVGMIKSTGKYLAFIDGDDRVTPIYISTILEALKLERDYYEMSWRSFGTENKTWIAGHLKKSNTSVWCRVFKRNIILYLFDENRSTGEDTKFLRENINVDLTKGLISDIMYEYRRGRPGSLITTYREKG